VEKFFQGFVVDEKGRIMKGYKSSQHKERFIVEQWAETLMQKNPAIDRILIMETVGLITR